MFDHQTLRGLTSIAPIRTIRGDNFIPFNKIVLERKTDDDFVQNGIVVTVNAKVKPDVDDVLDGLHRSELDFGTDVIRYRGSVTPTLRKCFDLGGEFDDLNYAYMFTKNSIVFRMRYARFQGVVCRIEELQELFNAMRRTYKSATSVCETDLVDVHIHGKTVKFTMQRLEETLFSMAYHFYQDNTEL
jgi:hypothetical protein